MQLSPNPVPQDLKIPAEALLDTRKLCRRFDAELKRVPGEHELITRFVHSPNRKELLARGRDALTIISRHLGRHPMIRHDVFWRGWAMLLSELETFVDPRRVAPPDLSDTRGWINWAHAMAPHASEV